MTGALGLMGAALAKAKREAEAAAAVAAAGGDAAAVAVKVAKDPNTETGVIGGAYRQKLKSLCRHEAFSCDTEGLGDGPAVVALDMSAAAMAAATAQDAATISAIKKLSDSGHGALEFACVIWCGKTAFNVLVSKLDAENMLTVLGRMEDANAV